MSDNLQLALNEALSLKRIGLAREQMLSGLIGMDTKRPYAWAEFGWPVDVDYQRLTNLYTRGGIAHGAVIKVVGTTWSTDPWIIEGDEADDSLDFSEWEESVRTVMRPRIWRMLAEVDKRRMVGRWAGAALVFRDGRRWDEEVRQGSRLERIIPIWGGALSPQDVVTDTNAANFGQPLKWHYRETIGKHERIVDIHPDRIFILGEWGNNTTAFLEPAYNALVNLEKIEGGSGESFLKNAARQIGVSFDKEVNLASLAAMYGVSLTELQEKFNEAAREINRGNDQMLITQGAEVKALSVAATDPEPAYNINLQTVAAALDIPTKILVGMQTGERASTEDQRYFNARCQSRRRDLGFEIEDFVRHLQRIGTIKPKDSISVIWDNLLEQTSSEKLDSATKMSSVNLQALGTGEIIFTTEEIRTAGGFDPRPADEQLDDVDDDGDAPTDPASF